jgi:enoyl-CoA hydratase
MTSYADGKMLSDIEDGVGLITFNQPAKRNAMSVDMWDGLGQILDRFADDDSVRVVVLTGAGHKAFVSGADISQFESNRADSNAQFEYDKLTSAGRAKLAAFPKPTISRVRGFCLGGGVGIIMQTDIRIAADDAEFGIPAARLGIAYGFDMVLKLVKLIGPAHAATLLYSGKRIDATEAQRMGLVNKVVKSENLSEEVVDLARAIADNAPLSVHSMKLAIGEAVKSESQRDHEAIDAAIAACFDSKDYREGRTAFAEKRPPRFHGN